jgi:di/tricarboxylate transporter
MVASMYVFAESVTRWGVAETIGQKLILPGPKSEAWLALKVSLVGGLLSTVLSNTAVVACLLPVVSHVARVTRVSVSRLLIPLSFATLIAGTVSVIGTSTNIAINSVLSKTEVPPFELFEFGLIGLVLLAVGCLYFFGPGRSLLPRSRVDESLSEHYQVPKFVTEVLVEPSSTLINRSVSDLPQFDQFDARVIGIVRAEGGGTLLAPGPYNRVRSDDTLILQGDPEAIVRLRGELGLKQRDQVMAEGTRLDSADVSLVEAVVPSDSPLAGRTLSQTDFGARTNLNVLGISKHGSVQPGQLATTRLTVGDTLLIQGHKRDIDLMRAQRELLFLGHIDLRPIGRGALVTLLTLAGVVITSFLGLLELSVAAAIGAVLLVMTRCLKAGEALRAIDWSVIILIGGMLALGDAFQRHGLADTLADWMAHLGSAEAHPTVLLAVLTVATMLLSQVVANVSAGVIMTPVALSLAKATLLEPQPFLLGVIVGASCAFMSPVSHQSNTMVTGPGNYKYRDFVRVGLPLSILVVVVTVLMVPRLFPFELPA